MSKTLLSNLLEKYVIEMDDEDKDIDRAPPPGSTGEYITSAQAARMLGVSMSRIRQMVLDKTLTSHQPTKGRRDHLLKRKDVQALKSNMPEVGRPSKDDDKDKKGKDDD